MIARGWTDRSLNNKNSKFRGRSSGTKLLYRFENYPTPVLFPIFDGPTVSLCEVLGMEVPSISNEGLNGERAKGSVRG